MINLNLNIQKSTYGTVALKGDISSSATSGTNLKFKTHSSWISATGFSTQKSADILGGLLESIVFVVSQPTSPSITVTSPNGGETWNLDTNQTISWTASNITPNIVSSGADWTFTVKLINTAAGSAPVILTNTLSSSARSYSFNVASNMLGAGSYKARVELVNNSSIFDESNSAFSIVAATTQIAAPTNLAANPVSCSKANLTWTDNSNNEDGFYIERGYSTGLIAWQKIGSVGPNVTTYPDTVGDLSGKYYYRIRAYKGNETSGYSNTAEVTLSMCTTGELKVLSPNGGEVWEIGTTQRISWQSEKLSSTVSIYIKNFTDPAHPGKNLYGMPNIGYYDWFISNDFTEGQYKITVLETNYVFDENDNYFTVKKSSTPSCFPDGTLVKLPDDPKVYVIINCQKKWIQTAEEFKEEGYKWKDVKETSSPVLQAYSDYLQAASNLLRAIGQERVYKVVNGKLLWVPTISAFNAQGLKWSDVQDVDVSQLNQYQQAKLIRASDDPKVYYITNSGLKRHIINEQVFDSYNNNWNDVATVSNTELNAYPNNTLIKQEGDYKVYKLEDGKKRWIKTVEAFNRFKYDWTKIAPANDTEINAYPEGTPIE